MPEAVPTLSTLRIAVLLTDEPISMLQCKQALSIDPGRLRRPVGVPQVGNAVC